MHEYLCTVNASTCRSHLECQLHKVLSLEGSMGTCHGNDLGLLDQQVVDTVSRATQQFKWPKLLQLFKDLAQMTEASLRIVHMYMYI